ncbi:MAG TPA: tRNA (adenosine(37)-N6)-threonylcarbamoyltransferase complex transferase subunit TsaD [Anaerolineales bacterium]|nr:tRNA (adenosine(37)-N6)-threonylcarbamoyltransferase complex transferase subunit TsaD [Anaerolineales bacterium]
MRVLAIETSCDETAAAVVEDGTRLLSNVVASQSDLHAQYGGVFPEVAARAHIETIYPVIEQALRQAHVSLSDLDALAVTRGPGLAGSLLVGVNAAKGLAVASNLPLLGIHHLEGHIYALWLTENASKVQFPLTVLLVSGGHTELLLMTDHLTYQRLGGTIDDAAGEAFDKVGRLLGLPYPGGPAIEKTALAGNPHRYNFARSWLEGTWNFSFSGLKTSVLRELQRSYPNYQAGKEAPPSGMPIADLAASFQQAALDVLVEKAVQAAEQFESKGILVAGGVSANSALKGALQARAGSLPVFVPPLALCGDNAAMIAAAACWHLLAQPTTHHGLAFDILPTWALLSPH